jgi:hypothetical protein
VGKLARMAPTDEVPEADRLEQETPSARAVRGHPRIPPDAPDADVLEQELPLVDEDEIRGIDAERTEPVSDDDWAATSQE